MRKRFLITAILSAGITLGSSAILASCGGGGSDTSSSTSNNTGGTGGNNTGGSSSNANCPVGTTAANMQINGKDVCVLSGQVTSNVHLTSDYIYELDGKVSVMSGAELKIDAGTTIYGDNSDNTTDYLVIERGGKINAQGTASAPIVFTGKQALEGTDTQSAGQWGGVILAGNAKTNAGDTNNEEQFEADADIKFGGNDDTDNSGTMKYVIIRNGGAAIAPDEEINGLTLCGVGSGTTLDYIEVYRNLDDGIEWFGGTVNAKHLVLIGNEDDNLDTDHGYRGKLQYVYIKQTVVSSSDPRGIEADNLKANNDATPRSAPVVANLTIENAVPSNATVQPHEAILLRRGTDYQIIDAVVTGNVRPDECLEVRNDATYTALSDNNHAPAFVSVALDAVCDKDGDNTPDYFNAKDNTNFTTVDVESLFTNGSNNVTGSATTTATDPSTIDSFFESANFVGAYDSNNDWRQGWTVGLND